eukprot:GFUD01012949.1.p1 GENE.GFUD01012949.1~~GFUD01012949.1.p1  ORF type:complete len:560 (+),score=162.79 GFUD01012949.1:134-1813(+)
MQKISLKVLLRFLSRYSHWNLVRRSDCYHLYFVTKESSSISAFPSSRCKQRNQKARRKGTKLNRDAKEVGPYIRKEKKVDIKEQQKKDVIVFSPIFQNAEQAVHVGLDNAIDEKSKMSSFSSLIWDDFLPAYKKESDIDDDDDKSSFTSVETLTDFDSRESTPFKAEQIEKPKQRSKKNISKKAESKYYETNVRKKGDKLLKDMLQLRRDIEDFKENPEEIISSNEKHSNEVDKSIVENSVENEKTEENILRERLEMMTLQIKQEMEEEMLKEKSKKDILGNKSNEDDDTKIKKFFQQLVLHDSVENVEQKPEMLLTTEPKEKEALNRAIQNLMEFNHEPETFEKKLNIAHNKAPIAAHNNSLDLENSKSTAKGKSPSVKVETLKRRKKTKKSSESKQIVEIPFCSHAQHTTGQDLAILPPLETNHEKNTKSPMPMNTILSPDEQLGAEEILHELIEIRDSGKSERNPVLDTMISIIQLSSTNVSLPSPATNGGGVQFRELFDFEVNFSESREAFAKLAGMRGPGQSGSKHTVTVQELFPWSGSESGTGPYNKLKGSLL